MDTAKLARMQAQVRIGGKGTPRRKIKKSRTTTGGGDDKKLQGTLKKLNVQTIHGIEQINMFKEDGNVLHFAKPQVQAALPSNTFVVYGEGQDKELTDLVPDILPQLGADSLNQLRKMAENFQLMQKEKGGAADEDDDDIPDLVAGENFESKVE